MSIQVVAVRVLVTGGAGRIGRVLREGLVEDATLRLLDREPQPQVATPHETVTADLADLDALQAACADVDAVVHLAAISGESDLPSIVQANILGTYHVLEAARRQAVPRVVLASSNHVVGYHPTSGRVDAGVDPRPDTFYGVSKLTLEGLGRLYADKFGLRVACLRIGSFKERPEAPRELGTWLSHGDGVRLVRACLDAPDLQFSVVYGISANTRAWLDLTPARALGYEPLDDAEAFADEVLAGAPYDPGPHTGGHFATPEHTLRHLEA